MSSSSSGDSKGASGGIDFSGLLTLLFRFFGLLTLLFIALKLTGVIKMSWFWVLSPVLIPLVIVGIIFLVVFIVCEKWKF